MSHHLDTPLAQQNGRLYIDDLYVFHGDGGTVFVLDVNSTITGADVQPGLHPEARYEFKVHVDDADVEALTIRVAAVDEPDSSGRQTVTVHALGQVALVNAAVAGGAAVGTSAWTADKAKNAFAGTTVQSIVVEVTHPVLQPGTRIGVWCATKLATDAGGWRQINTIGTPATFGFAGVNGRALADNAPETMFSLVLGTATTTGLKPSTNASLRTDKFPYVVAATPDRH